MGHVGLRVLTSLFAASILLARIVWPALQIDAVSLGLLALVLLPWLTPLIKSAELPGGWKVEFQDVEKAATRITGPELDVATTGALWRAPDAELADVPQLAFPEDSNLALVFLRMEVEKRLRAIATQTGQPATGAIMPILRALRANGILSDDQRTGLDALLVAGNHAAHGARVDASVANWTRTRGLDILNVLDSILIRLDQKSAG